MRTGVRKWKRKLKKKNTVRARDAIDSILFRRRFSSPVVKNEKWKMKNEKKKHQLLTRHYTAVSGVFVAVENNIENNYYNTVIRYYYNMDTRRTRVVVFWSGVTNSSFTLPPPRQFAVVLEIIVSRRRTIITIIKMAMLLLLISLVLFVAVISRITNIWYAVGTNLIRHRRTPRGEKAFSKELRRYNNGKTSVTRCRDAWCFNVFYDAIRTRTIMIITKNNLIPLRSRTDSTRVWQIHFNVFSCSRFKQD